MLTFTVHEPPNPPPDRIDRAESLVFIKDGFGWVAALFAPIWLLVHRLWWPLLGFIVLSGGFELIKRVTGVDQRWVGLAMLALNLLIGFEADTLRRWALERRGWRTLGSVTGKTAAECERRFFESAAALALPPLSPPRRPRDTAAGFFPSWLVAWPTIAEASLSACSGASRQAASTTLPSRRERSTFGSAIRHTS